MLFINIQDSIEKEKLLLFKISILNNISKASIKGLLDNNIYRDTIWKLRLASRFLHNINNLALEAKQIYQKLSKLPDKDLYIRKF